MLLIRGILGVMMQVAGLTAFLLIPAGTWHWPRAIAFLAAHGLIVMTAVVLLARYSPQSLEARMQPPLDKSQPVSDRVITILIAVTLMSWIAFVAVDVFRLQIFPAPPLWLSIVGAIASVTGLGTIMTALYQNVFAAPIVKDQSERGQSLIDSGLYGRIRHPFYAGYLLYLAGIGLWLESYASLLALPIMFAMLAARIHVEEKSLRTMLPEYPAYMERVRYRIVPGIW